VLEPQVWLGPRAPADAVRRLADHGVVVLGSTGRDDAAARLATRGGPLALRYHLFAALLALALAVGALVLVAAVDRDPRGAELSALRVQGLPAGTAARIARGDTWRSSPPGRCSAWSPAVRRGRCPGRRCRSSTTAPSGRRRSGRRCCRGLAVAGDRRGPGHRGPGHGRAPAPAVRPR